MGVRRALKLALNAAHDPTAARPIATQGPLIHNRQVLDVLAANDIIALDAETDKPLPGTVIIRAHGIPPDRQRELSSSASRIIDATCPHVRNVQKIVERYCRDGCNCVIVGDAGHAEVEGVLSYAGERGVVVSGPQDVESLPPMDRVVVVAQTTQNEDTFAQVVARIKERYPDCRVFDTICRSTRRRQAEAKELAQRVDAMVVVGGYDSANTRRLAEISSATGTPTFYVETDQQLDFDQLLRCRRIGVTAGASTPHWMILRVIHRIRSEHERRHRPALRFLRQAMWLPVRTNLLLGGGAAAMVFVFHRLVFKSPRFPGWCMALAFFFLSAQHLLHQCARREAMRLTAPEKWDFFQAHARKLQALGAFWGLLAVAVALKLPGWLPVALVLTGTAGGWLYAVQLGRKTRRTAPLRWLTGFPGGKELFVGLAWAVTVGLMPALAAGTTGTRWWSVAAATAFCFLIGGHRMLLTDLLDLEGDQLVGRETLAGVLGERVCKSLVLLLLAIEAGFLVVGGLGLLDWTNWLSFAMLVPMAYSGLCFLLFHVRRLPEGEAGEAMIDGTFYACGLLALMDLLVR